MSLWHIFFYGTSFFYHLLLPQSYPKTYTDLEKMSHTKMFQNVPKRSKVCQNVSKIVEEVRVFLAFYAIFPVLLLTSTSNIHPLRTPSAIPFFMSFLAPERGVKESSFCLKIK